MRILLSILVILSLFSIILVPTASAVILRTYDVSDGWGDESSATTQHSSTAEDALAIGFGGPAVNTAYEAAYKFNINESFGLPITNAYLYLTYKSQVGATPSNMTVWSSENQTWSDAYINWNMIDQKLKTQNISFVAYNDTGPYTVNMRFDVTNIVKYFVSKSYQNITFIVNFTTPNGVATGYRAFWSRKSTNDPAVFPMLNITYAGVTANYSDVDLLETRSAYYNITITDAETSTINASLFVNGTYYPTTRNAYGAYANISIPLLQGEINQSTYLYVWNLSFNGTNVTAPAGVQRVSRLRIIPCAAPFLNKTINFSVFDAILLNPVTTNFSAVIYMWVDSGNANRNYTYNQFGGYNYSYCLFPGWATYRINATITYTNTTQGSYVIQNQQFSNATTNINLYSLSSANSTNVLITAYNNVKVPQSNVIITAQKLFTTTGLFVTVAQGQTGYDGTVTLPLEIGQFYQYIISINGISVATIPSFQLNSNTLSLYITSNYVTMFNYINQVTSSCLADNSTYHLTCSINDQSGQMISSSLIVRQMLPANYSVVVCSLNSTALNPSYDCDLHLYNKSSLYYTLNGLFSGETQTFSAGFIFGADSALIDLGATGLLLTMMLTIVLFFAGMTNSPTTGMALACMGIIASYVSGLINIGWGVILPVILVAVIIIYKLED